MYSYFFFFFFFFNDTATTEIYTLSLHDALRSLLHDQAGWPGDGVVDRPFHRSGSRRTAVGPPQCGARADLLSAGSGDEQPARLSPPSQQGAAPLQERVAIFRHRARPRPSSAEPRRTRLLGSGAGNSWARISP